MQDPTFNPPPAQIDAILDAFSAPDQSLRQIAEACNATVPALSAWAARPEIAERIASLDGFAAHRARTAATFQLHRAVTVLTHSLDEFEHEQAHRTAARAAAPPPAREPGGRSSPAGRHPALYDPTHRNPLDLRDPPEPPIRIPKILDPEYIRRSRESARRAAALLYHIARFTPPRPGQPSPTPPTSRMGAGGGSLLPRADSPRDAPPHERNGIHATASSTPDTPVRNEQVRDSTTRGEARGKPSRPRHSSAPSICTLRDLAPRPCFRPTARAP